MPDAPAAVPWTAASFAALVERHRHELVVHCYRMLGSLDDAEDAVQDAFARAWRRRATYREAISARAWLYRIATNVCLDALGARRRRAFDDETVGPIPDVLLLQLEGTDDRPEARYDARESVSLAFLRLLQLLPPRQRAVLILRDVLAWRANEVAALLDVSVPAVNSALQRARETVRANEPPRHRPPSEIQPLLDRYVRAWEAADIPGLVGILRDDARLAMAPRPPIVGAQAIGDFLAGLFAAGSGLGPMRIVPTGANGQPAFGAYVRQSDGERRLYAVLVLTLADASSIARIDASSDAATLVRFELPATLPG